MKTLFLIFFIFTVSFNPAFSQGISINTSGASADSSALLDLSSSAKGVLIPRMTESEKNNIANPANGLLIYQTDGVNGFWYYNGAGWAQAIGPQGVTGSTGVTGAAGGSSQNCPSGFVGVNAQYCIEADEHAPANWYDANTACVNAGARLCSWGEWYSACNLTAGLNNMKNNWEWVDESGNSIWVTAVGGNGNCTGNDNKEDISSYSYRCCYSRGSGPAGVTGATGPTGGACPRYIGESYGGGIIFYINQGACSGLIAATGDQSAATSWSNVTGTLIGASAQSFTDGLTNTSAVISQPGHTSSAALICVNYNGGGYSDWYLPAASELKMISNEVYSIGNFTSYSTRYWSSTEKDATTACDQALNSGSPGGDLKSNATFMVRCIRRF